MSQPPFHTRRAGSSTSPRYRRPSQASGKQIGECLLECSYGIPPLPELHIGNTKIVVGICKFGVQFDRLEKILFCVFIVFKSQIYDTEIIDYVFIVRLNLHCLLELYKASWVLPSFRYAVPILLW